MPISKKISRSRCLSILAFLMTQERLNRGSSTGSCAWIPLHTGTMIIKISICEKEQAFGVLCAREPVIYFIRLFSRSICQNKENNY